MDEVSPRLLVSFVRSVAVLGLSAEAQASWLHQLFADAAPVVDELALEYDDGFLLVSTFIQLGWLSAAALPVLEQLDAQLDAMSGERNAQLWNVDALVHEEWNRIRSLATEALSEAFPTWRGRPAWVGGDKSKGSRSWAIVGDRRRPQLDSAVKWGVGVRP